MIIKYHSNRIKITILGTEADNWKKSRKRVESDHIKKAGWQQH